MWAQGRDRGPEDGGSCKSKQIQIVGGDNLRSTKVVSEITQKAEKSWHNVLLKIQIMTDAKKLSPISH